MERRLAAILVADVVGYSTMMGTEPHPSRTPTREPVQSSDQPFPDNQNFQPGASQNFRNWNGRNGHGTLEPGRGGRGRAIAARAQIKPNRPETGHRCRMSLVGGQADVPAAWS